jgi:hypothetical protein
LFNQLGMPTLQIETQFSNLSLQFAVRLESPGPNSQLLCSADCLQDNSSAWTTHHAQRTHWEQCILAIPLLLQRCVYVCRCIGTAIFYCCLWIYCRENVFTEPLPSNGCATVVCQLSDGTSTWWWGEHMYFRYNFAQIKCARNGGNILYRSSVISCLGPTAYDNRSRETLLRLPLGLNFIECILLCTEH